MAIRKGVVEPVARNSSDVDLEEIYFKKKIHIHDDFDSMV